MERLMPTPKLMNLKYKVGIVGCPPYPDVPWTLENIEELKALGFNTLQLNIAWGYRPADEILNLEDVVQIPAERKDEFVQPVPLRSNPNPSCFVERGAALRHRIALCRQAGVRSIFHFGAPFNAHLTYGDNPPNCLLDGRTQGRYVELLRLFSQQFPGVDDLWLYTYDQDAWLCSEFGDCPHCGGIPLHERVTGFVNRLASGWRQLQPEGRLWWEPWELSAGQVFKSIGLLDSAVVGLGLHSNIAEVMAAQPVDRWLELTAGMAREANLPVIVEHVFGNANEELGGYRDIACPQTLLRALRSITKLPIDGIKEYYGLLPGRNDIGLKLTGIFLNNPQLTDAEMLRQLAEPYDQASGKIIRYWEAVSRAIEYFPWNTTWWMREFSHCRPQHGMDAAFLRGQQAHTPSWESSRRSIFMKTDDLQPDPWMLEDVQLQCELSADRAALALKLGEELVTSIPASRKTNFTAGLSELRELRRRILSYAYHLRETNIATIMRNHQRNGTEIPVLLRNELLKLLIADQENQGQSEPLGKAIQLLKQNLPEFLEAYFKPPQNDPAASGGAEGAPPQAEDKNNPWSRFTVTSR